MTALLVFPLLVVSVVLWAAFNWRIARRITAEFAASTAAVTSLDLHVYHPNEIGDRP